MIRVNHGLIARLRSATTQADLFELIRAAIKLEHSTVPPYLAALYSLRPGANQAAAAILTSIVREEMLHMTIAANLLIALGDRPDFSARGFVPSYPSPLPLQIDDDLVVGLEPCSRDLIYRAFMRIEQPAHPLALKLKTGGSSDYPDAAPGEYPTIGDFYKALIGVLSTMPVHWGPAAAQVTPETTGSSWFRESDWFPITSLESAAAAVAVIVSEGEGASTSPVDNDGDPAHFYRFGQIYYGAALVEEPDGSYSFTGPDIPFDETAVAAMTPNARAAMYAPGTRARTLVDQFNQAYMQILLGLDGVFHGHPRRLNEVLGLMYQLRILAYEVLAQPDPNDPARSTGLSFEYVERVSS